MTTKETSSGTSPNRSRRWARALLLCVALVGVVEFVLHLYHKTKSPRPEDWAMLAGPVGEDKRAEDVVIVAPSWADPWARQALGQGVFPLRDVARPDVSRYPAALEIGALGQTSPELAEFREVSRRRVGPFVLRRLENPHYKPLTFDFVDNLHNGHVDVRMTQPEAKCIYTKNARTLVGGLGGHPGFPAARFECPGGAFFNVSQTVIADQDFRPRRCMWAHPPGNGELVIRFSDVPLGSVIRGHGGMYWIIERDRPGAPVTINVRVDGTEIGHYEHKDGDGWSLFEMPLGEHAGKTKAVVEFGITTKNYLHRHFCFEADSR